MSNGDICGPGGIGYAYGQCVGPPTIIISAPGGPPFVPQDPNEPPIGAPAAPPTTQPGIPTPPIGTITVTGSKPPPPPPPLDLFNVEDVPPTLGMALAVPVPKPRKQPKPRRTRPTPVRTRPRRPTRPAPSPRFTPGPLFPPSESPFISGALRFLGIIAEVFDVATLALMPGDMGPTQEEESAATLLAHTDPNSELQPFVPDLPARLPEPAPEPNIGTVVVTASPLAGRAADPLAPPGLAPLSFPQLSLAPSPALATGLAGLPVSIGRAGVGGPGGLGLLTLPEPEPVPQAALAGCPPCRPQQKQKKKKKARNVCFKGVYYERANGLNKHRKEQIPCR